MPNAIYRDHMGSDLTIVNNARVSFAKKSELVNGKLKTEDEKLIGYLARGVSSKEWEALLNTMVNLESEEEARDIAERLTTMATHWAPFAGTSIQLEMKAPVPIRTQCFKHKVGFVESEESRRYIKSTPELYIPDTFSSIPDNVKQGAGDVHPKSDILRTLYISQCNDAINTYEYFISMGVAPEEARFILPQGVYVNWIWTGSLASYARYYNQRSDAHAQSASRDLAQEVGDIIYELFPVSWLALCPGYVPKINLATPVTPVQDYSGVAFDRGVQVRLPESNKHFMDLKNR